MADLAELSGSTLSRDSRPGVRVQNFDGIAIIPVNGIIVPGILGDALVETTSAASLWAAFEAAVNSTWLRAIVLSIDSRGGQLEGLLEFSEAVYRSRNRKPIKAAVTGSANGAAYLLAAAASEVVITPSGEAGALGAIAIHTSTLGLDTKAGVRRTIIASTSRKAELSEFRDLTEDATKNLQSKVNAIGQLTADAIDKYRGRRLSVTAAANGRTYLANDAVRLALADRIGTLDDVLRGLR
jgi:ClpP class serine protease